MKNEKISSVKDCGKLFERKKDSELWKKVKKLSKGTPKDKILAVDTIFKKHDILPEASIKTLKQLADKKQPLEVRLQIAGNLIKDYNILFETHQTLVEILSASNDEQINKILLKTFVNEFNEKIQKDLLPVLKQMSNSLRSLDWEKSRRAYHISMIRHLRAAKDDGITAILSQVLAEYWLNVFMKNLFHNSKELSELSFNTKRKILFGLKLLKSNTNGDLKKLNEIRNEYAHNFVVDDKKILGILEKMDCHKTINFKKNSKNNTRIKECAIKLISDLMNKGEEVLLKIQLAGHYEFVYVSPKHKFPAFGTTTMNT